MNLHTYCDLYVHYMMIPPIFSTNFAMLDAYTIAVCKRQPSLASLSACPGKISYTLQHWVTCEKYANADAKSCLLLESTSHKNPLPGGSCYMAPAKTRMDHTI
jgi:hypothetical protein